MRLNEKVSIVTGGGSGIGRATCQRFGKEGSSVVVAEINEESGQGTVDLIKTIILRFWSFKKFDI